MNGLVQLWLTCASKKEADGIAASLLGQKLIACARQLPVHSDYRWQGKIEQADEILLIMDSKEDLFKKIEAEVTKLHSYDTYVLQMVPVEKISGAAAGWLSKELL